MSENSTLLVVDDEPRYVRLVQVNLETAGYEVETAHDGQKAVEHVEADEIWQDDQPKCRPMTEYDPRLLRLAVFHLEPRQEIFARLPG